MLEPEAPRVEHLARGPVAGDFREPRVWALAVGVIPDERVAEVLEVDADLVGAAGVERGLEPGGTRSRSLTRNPVQASRPPPSTTAICLRCVG